MSPEQPLAGRRIWVTAERRSTSQRRYLEQRGATVTTVPVLETIDETEVDIGPIAHSLVKKPPEVVIAQTGQGMAWWFDKLDEGLRSDVLGSFKDAEVWARGAKATSRCRSLGLNVAWQAESERALEIAERVAVDVLPGKRVALQLVGTTHDIIYNALVSAGASIVSLPVYRYALPTDTTAAHELIRSTINGEIDAITFTASPSILHVHEMARELGLHDRLNTAMHTTCKPIVVGPVAADTARDCGWNDPIEPPTARLIPMLDALTEAFKTMC